MREREGGRDRRICKKKNILPPRLSPSSTSDFPEFFFVSLLKSFSSEGKRGPKIRGQRRGPDNSFTLFLNFSANKCFFGRANENPPWDLYLFIEEYFLTVSSFPKLKIFDTGLAFLSLWIL